MAGWPMKEPALLRGWQDSENDSIEGISGICPVLKAASGFGAQGQAGAYECASNCLTACRAAD